MRPGWFQEHYDGVYYDGDDDDDELCCGMVNQRKTFSLISS